MTLHACPRCDCRPDDDTPPQPGRGSDDYKRRHLIEQTKRELAERKRNREIADPNGVTHHITEGAEQ